MIGYDDSVDALPRSLACIPGIEYSFQNERSLPMRTNPRYVVPGHTRIEVLAYPREEILKSQLVLKDGSDIPEHMRAAPYANIPGPARMSECLSITAQFPGPSGGAGETRSMISIARPRHWHIDRENKRRTPNAFSLRQERDHKGPIPDHVELKPARARRRSRDFG